MSSIVINHLPAIDSKTYLELGVFDGKNFELINAKIKESVDVNGNATFTGTTDEYFKQIDKHKRFDIIFIDANHDHEFVVRDFNNSINHCNEWVLIHDMVPPTKKYTKPSKCSDSYKVLYHLMQDPATEVYTMNENFGLSLIKMPGRHIDLRDIDKNLRYENFMEYIKSKKLYNTEEIINILGGRHV